MEKSKQLYAIGDTVVHQFYGVGKIDAVESKLFDGVKIECYKVITKNSIYWFPKNGVENPRIHPVASQELIEEVVEILQQTPDDLENDPAQWQERIDGVMADGSFLAISKLVRDLSALKAINKLSRIQDQALNTLIDRLLREWAAGLAVDANSIRPRLRAYLNSNPHFQGSV